MGSVGTVLLDQLIESLDLEVEPFALCEVGAGSDLEIGDLGWVTVHFVLSGEGEVRLGRSVSPVARYGLVLVRHRHDLHGIRGSEAPQLEFEGVQRLHGAPSGAPDFVVACGRIQATYGGTVGIFGRFDEPIVLDFSQSEDMRHVFDGILRESEHRGSGSKAMLRALMRQCLISVLRELSEEPESGLPWVDALSDEGLAVVVETVLADPGSPHSVASLAEAAHMSRSAFAARFKVAFDQTPMNFVRSIRLRKGADLLLHTDLAIGAIAHRTGFSSRSHFVELFKHEFEATPSRFREAHLVDPV